MLGLIDAGLLAIALRGERLPGIFCRQVDAPLSCPQRATARSRACRECSNRYTIRGRTLSPRARMYPRFVVSSSIGPFAGDLSTFHHQDGTKTDLLILLRHPAPRPLGRACGGDRPLSHIPALRVHPRCLRWRAWLSNAW